MPKTPHPDNINTGPNPATRRWLSDHVPKGDGNTSHQRPFLARSDCRAFDWSKARRWATRLTVSASFRSPRVRAPALAFAAQLQARGYGIRAIRPPTVPAGTARLRVSMTAKLTQPILAEFVGALIQIRKEVSSAKVVPLPQ